MSERNYFYQLADHLQTLLQGGEFYTAWFSGEDSSFCRLNHAKVRQVGDVRQRRLEIRLIQGQKSVTSSITLSGSDSIDKARVAAAVTNLRGTLEVTPEDPYLLYATDVNSTEDEQTNALPESQQILSDIMDVCCADDLVGILAQGAIYHGFANSAGQRNWHKKDTFHFDYSLYHAADKAVKNSYAGFAYDKAALESRIEEDRRQLAILKQAPHTLDPGKYRAYLSPAAMEEFVSMLCWGGFGKKSHMTKRTPLLQMVEEGRTMNAAVTIQEDTKGGIAPGFNRDGYVKPDVIDLVSAGQYRDTLVSARSAKEFGIPENGADGSESPGSIAMAGGSLRDGDILSTLDTGLYINNLWYLNFSDRITCRLTGMTRFAAFWVEKGEIVAPLNVMRFDDSIYRILGENLVALTERRDFLPSSATYRERSVGSSHLPGAVVKDFSLTL